MSGTRTGREVRLRRRPVGEPVASDFELVETQVRPPGDGEVLVRNRYLSVDPYMRGRMSEAKSYAPPYRLGEPMTGRAVGEVIQSGSPDVANGALVRHDLGWREFATLPATAVQVLDPDVPSPSLYLGLLGMTGLTAYVGLVRVASMTPGDVVFVSGAAGAVGSAAGQLARVRGAGRVIGSAGSPEKVRYLIDELGFDVAFDYHDGPVAESLAAAAPAGVDVYFDNVGGEHLEAAIANANTHARFAICGMISQYNAVKPPAAPRNLGELVKKRLALTGFLVSDHLDLAPIAAAEISGHLKAGRLRHRETTVNGIDHAVDAFLDMMRGANIGKMVVELSR